MANYKLLNNQGVDATHPGVITEITNEQDYTYQNGLGGSKISFKCTLKERLQKEIKYFWTMMTPMDGSLQSI